ncbi:MAG TPA: hypothetical protein VJA94_05900 [Candidatus Angelobacter sp.]
MNAVVRVVFATVLFLGFNIFSVAQRTVPTPPPPQSPRQALIEIIKGGDNALMKHLTVEVQQLLTQTKNKERFLRLGFAGAFGSEPGVEVETFETGPVLLSFNSPKEHKKFEVDVNTDDLRGDQDTLELSFHQFQDGEEQEPEWQPFLSHFSVTLVQQKEIWRLSKVNVGAEFDIGDPEFLKKTMLKGADKETTARQQERREHTPNDEPSEPPAMSGEQVVMMLGYAESSFASQHPELGFTCSLADLGDTAKQLGLESTGSFRGYRINLTGCQGRPSGSFQITAEPTTPTGKAYCTDATHNIRVSDDGRASTCLLAGRSTRVQVPDEDESVGVDSSSAAAPAKPKEPQ